MATGSATIDFGSGDGSNEASIAITGQTTILSTSYCEAFQMAEVSGSHTVNDAAYASLFIYLTCGVPTASTGFTIYAKSTQKMTGTFLIRWVWV